MFPVKIIAKFGYFGKFEVESFIEFEIVFSIEIDKFKADESRLLNKFELWN